VADGDDAAQADQRSPLPLSSKARIFSGLLGLAALGLGTAAIFVKNNNGGSLALIGVGAVFLLMSITGYGLRSFKFGPVEGVMDTVAQARALKSRGDDEGAAQVIETLIEKPLPVSIGTLAGSEAPPDAGSRLMSSYQYRSLSPGLIYEQEARAALDLAVTGRGLILPDARSGGRRFDMLARVNDSTFAVEVRQGTHLRPAAFADAVRSLMAGSEVPLAGLLVVVNASPDSDEGPRLMAHLRGMVSVPFLIWSWRAEDGPTRMQEGVDLLLAMVDQSDKNSQGNAH
jgi:hypothetical protein